MPVSPPSAMGRPVLLRCSHALIVVATAALTSACADTGELLLFVEAGDGVPAFDRLEVGVVDISSRVLLVPTRGARLHEATTHSILLVAGRRSAGQPVRVHVRAFRGSSPDPTGEGDVVATMPESGRAQARLDLDRACICIACDGLFACVRGSCSRSCLSDQECQDVAAGCTGSDSFCDRRAGRVGTCDCRAVVGGGDGGSDAGADTGTMPPPPPPPPTCAIAESIAPLERQCSSGTTTCIDGCLGDASCQSSCLSSDPPCRACISNNYRYCALRTSECGSITRDWICCLERAGCLDRAFDSDCQTACNSDAYVACLDSIATRCEATTAACFAT